MFITFEGMEGSGKGSVIKAVCSFLDEAGRDFLLTREPGGSALGRSLRALLLDARQKVSPEAELFMYLADRAQHVEEIIRPALQNKQIVISDRYADSTIVYQGYGRGLPVEKLFRLNEAAVKGLWPRLTVLLDVAPETGLERALRRNEELGLTVKEGRFEAESLAFHTRVREGYLDWAEKNSARFRIIDASKPLEDVVHKVLETIKEELSG